MTIRFAHISDTHIGPDPSFRLYGVETLPRLERLVDCLNAHAAELDFVVHTGDLVQSPDAASFSLAAATLARLQLPLYTVVGNHDTAQGLRELRLLPPVARLDETDDAWGYHFRYGSESFVVIDGRGPDEIDPRGVVGDRQLRALQSWLETTSERVSVFVHFPAVPLDCRWLDAEMRLIDELAFRELLESQAQRIRGVFFGHVHRGMQIMRRGILYSAVPSSFCQFQSWPGQLQVEFDASSHAFFHLVTLTEEQVQIRQMYV